MASTLTERTQAMGGRPEERLMATGVSLREVERAVRLADQWGVDAAEHADLLDEPGLLRLVWGVRVEHGHPADVVRLDAHGQRPIETPRWEPCPLAPGQPGASSALYDLLAEVEPTAPGIISAWHREWQDPEAQPLGRQGFGPRLRELRRRAGLTQAQVAELVGREANTIARWERGERLPGELVRQAALHRVWAAGQPD